MNVKRKIAVTVLVGAGLGLSGCQAPLAGGPGFWNKGSGSSQTSATPDVSKQKYEGLSKQFGSQSKTSPSVGLGGQPPATNDNFLTASWKKTTAAVSGTFAAKPKDGESTTDPLRLDSPPKKVGPEVFVAAARMLENQGKFAEAQAQYEKALHASPSDVNTLVGLARLHDRQGRSREALEIYQKAIKAQPNSGLVYNDLGLCYSRQGQHELALGAIRKAIDLQPDNAKYHNNLATVLVDAGRPDDALKHLTTTTSPAVAHYNIGYLLMKKGQRDEAMRHCQQALAIDPGLTPARELLGSIGGNFDASPLAAQPQQPQPQPASPSLAAQSGQQTIEQPAAVQPLLPPAFQAPEYTGQYGAGATTQPIYTSAPQAPQAMATTPPNFHIGDDGPAAQTAARDSKWDGWPAGATANLGNMQPLPPVE